MRRLKVGSLDYDVVPVRDGFKVGCQTITKRDAAKIAEFLTKEHSLLPKQFYVKIPSKKVGAKLVELLHHYTQIRVHGEDSIETSNGQFSSYFTDHHTVYRVRDNELIGGIDSNCNKELTLVEIMDILL